MDYVFLRYDCSIVNTSVFLRVTVYCPFNVPHAFSMLLCASLHFFHLVHILLHRHQLARVLLESFRCICLVRRPEDFHEHSVLKLVFLWLVVAEFQLRRFEYLGQLAEHVFSVNE